MWIPSKLTRPKRLHNAILRPRVLELLKQAPHYKLILFRSPAGYGKTTMAAQWLAEQPNVGWFSIDDSDNESFRFVNYFLRALNVATDNACRKSQSLAEKRQFSSLKTLFSEVFAEVSQVTENCFVVLDDYHCIENEEIHEGMRFFLKHLPDNITLVATSRALPPLGVANLRVRDLMIEVDNDSLAFDNEETARFFKLRVADGIDDSTANALRHYVEGWPSALQLFALQAQHQKKSLVQSVETLSDFNHTHLWDYLLEEVFELLDSETRQFLMQCSVFDTFNDVLASKVTGREDALGMIETLNRFGLFIYSLEGEQNWYRFHNLFGEFLSHERQTHLPAQDNKLHSSAAHAWLSLKNPDQALSHSLKSKDDDLIVDVLDKHGWAMFNKGELVLLDRALEYLPPEKRFSQPSLALLRAWLAQSQHQYDRVASLLAEAEQQLKLNNIELTNNDQGQVNALLAQVAINQNEPEKAQTLADLALSQLSPTTYRSRIVATSVMGEVNHVLGHLDRALPLMQQTEKLARQYQIIPQALWALLQQSEILIAQGYVQAAYEVQDNALKLVEEQHLHQLPLHEFLLRIRAQVLWGWNRLDEAEDCVHRGLDVLGKHDQSNHLHGYSMLARIAIGRGELDKASRYVDQILYLIQLSDYHIDWSANASLSLLLFWQAKGATQEIEQWLGSVHRPTDARNHFSQLQWRNICRAYASLNMLEKARDTLAFLQSEALKANLVTDQNRNLIVEASIQIQLGDSASAESALEQAIKLTTQTGLVGYYLIEGEILISPLQKLLSNEKIGDLEKHRIQQLLKDISSRNRNRSVHFDEQLVEKLVNHPNVPELVRTSPLTQREWQVLGLIYAGLSNEQISQELDVAGTTIKTHIRNLYQKLAIANRKQAIETAENLLHLMGYA
ncbi:HTH-type transcriptional regulator MalT [Vibrio nigripulchritudo]|uniref:HTH-type transcriptional regulator MalT n=1 Tax=Vibrio nigripulchritudo TaxID=28173 RepID=UPI0005F9FA2D|nr:HTH-type transcriptional regulator MalT [Vibrio nigripulchritudo]KJY75144.1 transcriptional regulator MalT [Vibrio nigripulchritudo]